MYDYVCIDLDTIGTYTQPSISCMQVLKHTGKKTNWTSLNSLCDKPSSEVRLERVCYNNTRVFNTKALCVVESEKGKDGGGRMVYTGL